MSVQRCLCAVLLLVAICHQAVSQTPAASPSLSDESSSLNGVNTGISSSAMAVVASHLNAVQAGQWTALTATGTITLPDSSSLPVSLTLSGSSNGILRISNVASGHSVKSITSDGQSLQTVYADGSIKTMMEEAGLSGIMQFQLLRDNDFASRLVSLQDRQTVTVDGHVYRRVIGTFAEPHAVSGAKKPQTLRVVFDFQPDTLYLARTIAKVKIPGSPGNHLSLVTSYSDYRAVDKVLIPHIIAQTLDGQREWTLTLTNVSLPAAVDSSLFTY